MLLLRLFWTLFLCVASLAQRAELIPAPLFELPGVADSNSPSVWYKGQFVLFNSDGMPVRTEGEDQFSLKRARASRFHSYANYPMWIEAAWIDDDGKIYAWYHNEPLDVCGGQLTAPRIGALVSRDGGLTFEDFGIVLESGDPPDCSAQNGYFAGGHGDFTVLLDASRSYFYFYFSNYGGSAASQGIAVARMAFEDRDNPYEAVYKYHQGKWEEPGYGGAVTPIFPVRNSWASNASDAFWGPSLHWNTYLGKYVMLFNHACCETGWPPAGIFVSFNADLGNPQGWSIPEQILEGGGWYPQVIGLDSGDTDKQAGSVARFYLGSDSAYEIVFHK